MATYTLTNSGAQSIATPGSLAITITVFPSGIQQGAANPTNWYHLGLLRLGNTRGYLPSVPLDATNMLLPCPVGVTLLGYSLRSGVTITVEERAEILQPLSTLATSQSPPSPSIISPFTEQSLGTFLASTATATPAGGAYVAANRAMYYPFRLSAPFTSAYAWWANGTTVGANVDVGVYDSAFARLASIGSTGQGSTQAVGSASLAITLQPGLYYLGLAMNSSTAQLYGSILSTPKSFICGGRTQSTAFPLPNPAVPTANSGTTTVYVCGLSTFAP